MITLLKPAAICILSLAPLAFSGCDTDEKVLDIDTPNGGVEVERDRLDGDVDVDVDRD